MASGFGPVAGLLTAIVGGVVVSFFAGSPMTIKGPAAGLVPIAYGCIEAFRADPATAGTAFQCALAVVVVAGVLQILLGIANVKFGLPLWVATAHNGIAAALLFSLVALLARTTPAPR